jgi:hypothetical protein
LDDVEIKKYEGDFMFPYCYAKRKFNGQTVLVKFQSFEFNSSVQWNIVLSIYSKRKHDGKNHEQLKHTGKIGLDGLLFARKAIIAFEEFLKTEFSHVVEINKFVIYCGWLDNKRRDIYHRGLTDLGFSYGLIDNKKVLMKTILNIKE